MRKCCPSVRNIFAKLSVITRSEFSRLSSHTLSVSYSAHVYACVSGSPCARAPVHTAASAPPLADPPVTRARFRLLPSTCWWRHASDGVLSRGPGTLGKTSPPTPRLRSLRDRDDARSCPAAGFSGPSHSVPLSIFLPPVGIEKRARAQPLDRPGLRSRFSPRRVTRSQRVLRPGARLLIWSVTQCSPVSATFRSDRSLEGLT